MKTMLSSSASGSEHEADSKHNFTLGASSYTLVQKYVLSIKNAFQQDNFFLTLLLFAFEFRALEISLFA